MASVALTCFTASTVYRPRRNPNWLSCHPGARSVMWAFRRAAIILSNSFPPRPEGILACTRTASPKDVRPCSAGSTSPFSMPGGILLPSGIWRTGFAGGEPGSSLTLPRPGLGFRSVPGLRRRGMPSFLLPRRAPLGSPVALHSTPWSRWGGRMVSASCCRYPCCPALRGNKVPMTLVPCLRSVGGGAGGLSFFMTSR
jgi:hypothetical protein